MAGSPSTCVAVAAEQRRRLGVPGRDRAAARRRTGTRRRRPRGRCGRCASRSRRADWAVRRRRSLRTPRTIPASSSWPSSTEAATRRASSTSPEAKATDVGTDESTTQPSWPTGAYDRTTRSSSSVPVAAGERGPDGAALRRGRGRRGSVEHLAELVGDGDPDALHLRQLEREVLERREAVADGQHRERRPVGPAQRRGHRHDPRAAARPGTSGETYGAGAPSASRHEPRVAAPASPRRRAARRRSGPAGRAAGRSASVAGARPPAGAAGARARRAAPGVRGSTTAASRRRLAYDDTSVCRLASSSPT